MFRIKMTEVGDGLRRAFGSDHPVFTVGRLPDMGEGQKFPRERIFPREHPVVMQMFRLRQDALLEAARGAVPAVSLEGIRVRVGGQESSDR